MADALEPLLAAASNTTSAITAPILEELGNEVDLATCRLLGPFALAIQGIMGAAVLGSLVVKRMREKPRRKWKIWLADVSKQVIGQAFVHASNVAISDLIAMHTSDNPCSLYALNIITDTTLGVLILYWLLQLSTRLMRQYAQPLYETGYYGSPFSLSLWGEQAAVYVACLTAMKVVVLILFWLFPFLEDVMSWTLSWITNEEAQVFVVMLVIPLFMNLFQFLMIDSFLKSKETHSPVIGGETDEEAQRRGFLEDEGEEDGDESFDDRNMREIRRKSGSEDGEDRGYSGLGGNDDDDDDDDDDKYRKKERLQARQLHAVNLFDADLEGDDSVGDASGTRTQPNMHSYPPPHPAHSAAPAQSTNPPPYSSPVAPTSDVEDAWDEDWSGSDATRSRPPSPAPALSPAPPSTGSPAAAMPEGITFEAPTTPPVATTSGLSEESTPASPPASVSGGIHAILGEGGVEDDWGFGHEEDAAEAEAAKSSGPALSSLPAAAPVEANDCTHPPSPAAQLSAIAPSLAYAPSPAPDADDWGLDLEEETEPMDAQESTSASVSEALPAAHESAVEAGSAADRSVEKIDGVGHSDPPAHASDEDEWGFQEEHEDAVTESATATPSEEVPPPATVLWTENGVDTTLIDSSANATPGNVAAPEQISATTEEDDLDDWGFHDTPSLTQDVEGQDELKNDLSRIAQGRPESAKSDAQPTPPPSLL